MSKRARRKRRRAKLEKKLTLLIKAERRSAEIEIAKGRKWYGKPQPDPGNLDVASVDVQTLRHGHHSRRTTMRAMPGSQRAVDALHELDRCARRKRLRHP